MGLTNVGERLASVKVGGFRYNSPWTQVALVGVVCFLSPGLFNALSGLGAGGQQDVALVDIANSVLYALFAITGFFAGSVNNILGPRLTMCFGTMGYSLYVGSLWCHQTQGNRVFVIVAGGILGFCAALLWSAQGAIMMAYPMEKDKGRSFSMFWSIFTMGGVVGSCIAFGIQYNSPMPQTSTAVYLVFLILMIIAIFVTWLVLPPTYVVRSDGTVVDLTNSLTVKEELSAFARQFKDIRMLLLFPMFFTSNYFYSYQGAIVAFLFNPRTRALSALITNVGAVVGSIFIGFVLDFAPGGRRSRAVTGWMVCMFFLCLAWGGGIAWQTKFKRSPGNDAALNWAWDFKHSSAWKPLLLLFTYYFSDSCYQGLAYYTMSALTNDPFALARMTGYYKGVQSAGAAVSFGMDAVYTPYMTEVIVSFVIMAASMPLCLFVLWRIKDTNYTEENTHHVEDLNADQLHHAALPSGHHTHDAADSHSGADEKFETSYTNKV